MQIVSIPPDRDPTPSDICTLTRVSTSGDADKYVLTLEDGSEHRFVVSGVEKKVDGDSGVKAIRRAIDRIREQNHSR